MKNHLLTLKGKISQKLSSGLYHTGIKTPWFHVKKFYFLLIFVFTLPLITYGQETVIDFISAYYVTDETAPNQSDGTLTCSLDQFQNGSFEMYYEYKIPGNNQVRTSLYAINGVLFIENLHPGEYFNVKFKVTDGTEIWSLPIDSFNIERSFFQPGPEMASMEPDDSIQLETTALEINCPALTFTHCNGTTVSRGGLQGGFAYNISPADRTCGIEVSDSCTVDNVSSWLCIVGDFPPPLPYSQLNKVNYSGVNLDALTAARIAWVICHYDYPPNHQHPVINAIWALTGTGGNQNEIYWAAVNAVTEPDGSENHLVFYRSLNEYSQNYVNWQCCQVDGGPIGPDQEICSGQIPDVFMGNTALSGNGVLTYQWQQSTESCTSGFIDIEGATDTLLQWVDPVYQTMFFRRKVVNTISNVSCESYSNCLVLNVHHVEIPLIGHITQPTCLIPAGTVVISNLPDHNWILKIIPGELEFTGNSPVFTISGLLPDQVYYAEVIDSNDCHSGLSEPINISAIPEDPIVLLHSNSPVCNGSDVHLTCSISGGTGPYSFNWSGPNGFVSTAQNPVLTGVSHVQNGTYILTVTDANGCFGSAQTMVIVNSNPVVLATSNGPVCTGTNVQLMGLVSGGTTPYYFNWTGPNGFNSSVQNPVLTGANPVQNGTYILTVTDANGCVGSAQTMVAVSPNPVVVATSNAPVCIGSDVQLTGSVDGGTAPYSFNWSGPNGFVSSAQNPFLNGVSHVQNGTYILTVTDANGCVGSSQTMVTVNSNPVVNATSNAPVCVGSSVQLISSASGGTNPYSFNWAGPNGYVSTVQNPILATVNLLQNGIYALTVTDAKGCFDITNVPVLVKEVPRIITATPMDCDPLTNTYALSILVEYQTHSQGNLVIASSEGNDLIVPATGSPQNIIWEGLPSNGITGIDLFVHFDQTPECSSALNNAYNAPEDCSCNIDGIDFVAVCHDAQTQDPADDYFSIKLSPIGFGQSDSYYVNVVQSGSSQSFGPFLYGSFTAYFGQFLISDGDLEVSMTDSQYDCGHSIVISAPETCSSCTHPVLTAGNIQCNGNTYDVFYYHSEDALISANAGIISDYFVTGIPIGTDLEITADLFGCSTVLLVKSPDYCDEACDYPQITLGQPVCQGNTTYKVSFTWDGLGNMNRNAGTIQGNQVINIPIGIDLIVTVENGHCVTETRVESPADCNEPCVNPLISLSGPLCKASGSGFYSINFTKTEGVEVTVSAGILGAGVIYNIPIATTLLVMAGMEGCEDQSVIIPPPVCEDACTDPELTVGNIECLGQTYNVLYYHSAGSVIQVNAGTIEEHRIVGIPMGVELEIIAKDGSCITILKVASPANCEADCDYSQLTTGQPVCVGSTYTVSFTWDGLGNLTKNAGKIKGNQIIDIPLGVDLILTVTNGDCVTKNTVKAPIDCDCFDLCRKPLITLSGPLCSPVGSDFYSVHYFIRKGVVVISSAGIVGNGVIYNIPNGVSIQVIAQWPGCEDQVVVVPAPECEQPCIAPMLTVGNVVVKNEYFDVDYWHSMPSVISVNAGNIENNRITGVPEGVVLVIKATDGACETEIRVTGPETCSENCIHPELTVGQGVCTGDSYKVSFVWNGVGELTRNSGIISGNEIINIPLGIDLILTATNCDCSVQLRVVNPKDCTEICDHPAVSIGGTQCSPDNDTYSVIYSADPWALISTSAGVIGAGQIAGIEAGLPVVITTGHETCAAQIMQIPAPSCEFSSIGNFVWHDLNGDGLQNAGEPGIEGVALRLYDGLGNVIKTTQSNSGGFYEFGQLIPGEYFVEIVRPEDYSDFTLSKQGMDPAKDSNFDHANGYGTTSWIFLGSKAEDNNIDAGLYQCAEIAGQVWFDENQNDVLDTEEIGINGLQIKLFRREHTTWTLWDYIYTQNKDDSDEAGHWNFCVNPGEYYLEIPVVPVGMTVVLPFAGTDPEKDSDLTGANGARTTDAFTVGSGQQKTAIGAGFSVGSTLGNLVWFDENSNGYLDENESGMPGVSVDLFDDQGQEAGTVSTDDAGEFVFEGLEKGIYFIRVNQPQGYTFTTPKTERDDANGSDVNHANGWGTTSLYPLEAGESILLTAGLIYASLPVELTEFSGENYGDHNVLTWTTEREENSDRFILERKHASEAGFKAVGTVIAKGNGVEKEVYSFEDHQLPTTGVYYYRLDQRDKNGTKKYSKIIALEAEKEMTNDIAVFPNPARGRFEVRMALQEAGLVNMELLDSRGIAVRKDLLNSRLEPGHYVHVVELNGLSAGMYQLKVQTEKLLFMERVMVIE